MQARGEALREALAERILVLDGATGTWIQSQNLSAADFGGDELEGCNENLVLTRPDVVRALHTAYFEAGADMVETDTFGGTPLVLAEYGLQDKAFEINRRAAELAREVAAGFSTPERPRFVAGSMGPTTRSVTVTGGVTFEDLIGHYRVQAAGLLAGGADVLLLETTQDTRNLKAGLIGIQEAFSDTAKGSIYSASQLTPWRFVSSGGLWIGLAFAVTFLAITVRMRRYREPI